MIENELREVGARIKALREISGFTEEQAAEKTAVSLAEYRELESGKKDFPFTFIYKAADTFGVEMKDLLSGSSPILSLYTVVRGGKGLPITRRTGFTYENLAPSFKNKLAEPFWVNIPYSDEKPVFTKHNGQEIDIVVSGRLEIQIHDSKEVLNPGDTIYYNSSFPHALRALDGKDCTLYAIVIKSDKDENIDIKEFPCEPAKSDARKKMRSVADEFIETTVDKNGKLLRFAWHKTRRLRYARTEKTLSVLVFHSRSA